MTETKEFHWAGDHGEDYVIEPGMVWRVGRHTLVCSDLMATPLFDSILNQATAGTRAGLPSLVYCDPPWGQGLVNSFRTKAGLGPASYRWEQLYRRIADLGHSRGWPVWLEGSKAESRDGAKIPDAMHGPMEIYDHYWPIEYASHSPAGLYYSGTRPHPPSLTRVLNGMHDRDTPSTVMAAYGSDGLVVEPCCGLGGTPVNAVKAGWMSVNNEINPFRMSTALHNLAKATGEKPERVQ